MKEKYILNNSSSLLIYLLAFTVLFIWMIVNIVSQNNLEISISIILIIGLVFFSLKIAKNQITELTLEKELITTQGYLTNKKKESFNYNDITKIELKHPAYKRPSVIIFSILKNQKERKIPMDLQGNNDEIIDLILWLKNKNQKFQIIVYPKGTDFHTRLRQELLGFEY